MPSNNESKTKYKCPGINCGKAFGGSTFQITNNFKTHFIGAHIKKDDFEGFNAKSEELKELISLIGEDAYNEIVNNINYEPEPTIEDEYIFSTDCNNKAKNRKEDMEFIINLNEYLLAEYPVCREERQYALFLANCLKNNNRVIKEKLSLNDNDVIKEVFYEATLMRDYWHCNKKEFNKKLREFVENKEPRNSIIAENSKGEKNHPNYWFKSHYLAKWMMNAKPDIGLIIKTNGKYKLSFIECKYSSKVDTYKTIDHAPESPEKMEQTALQDLILGFLCNDLKLEYEEKPVQKGDVYLIKFNTNSSDDNNKRDTGKKEIPTSIKDLLDNEKILFKA
jgi:hypothetical protein